MSNFCKNDEVSFLKFYCNTLKVHEKLLYFPEPSDFYDETCATIYAEAKRQIEDEEKRKVNFDLLIKNLSKKNIENETLLKIRSTDNIVAVVVAAEKVERIKHLKRRRDAVDLLNQAIFDLNDETKDISSVLESASMPISKLAASLDRDDNMLTYQSHAVAQTIQETAAFWSQEKDMVGHATGLKKLDDAIGGVAPGELLVIAGGPGTGKSALASSVVLNMAKNKQKLLVYSLEMSFQQLVQREMAAYLDIDARAFRNKRHSQDAIDMLHGKQDKIKELSELNIIYYDKPSLTIQQLKSVTRMAKIKDDIDVVFIDYLTLMAFCHKSNRPDLEIGELITEIRMLAKELNVAFVVLSQINREADKTSTKKPTRRNLVGSSVIEQEAQHIVLMWCDPKNAKDKNGITEKITFIIEKSRFGESSAEFNMLFEKTKMRFSDIN